MSSSIPQIEKIILNKGSVGKQDSVNIHTSLFLLSDTVFISAVGSYPIRV